MKTVLKFTAGLLLAIGLFAFAFYRTPQEQLFTQHLKAAQQQDASAALLVAQDYLNGIGVKPDLKQAIHWYQQSYSLGNAQAALELARLYQTGQHLPAEPETSLAYLQAAAQGNVPQAQYELANAYTQGNHVPQHNGQALFWYMKAANNGSPAAQTLVRTLATEQPELSAQMTHFMQTLQDAQAGNSQAQLEVGQAYRYGFPILQNNQEAFAWLKKAWESSQQELFQAAFELADLYYKGEGTEKDTNRAMVLFSKAAENKNPAAQYQLGEFAYMDNPPRLEDAFAWFSNAAAQGNAKAQYMTGFMLLQGQGTAASVPLAIRFFEQAGQQNNSDAQYVLGQIYTKGWGVKKDPSQGRIWLEKAAENGNEAAKALLTPAV